MWNIDKKVIDRCLSIIDAEAFFSQRHGNADLDADAIKSEGLEILLDVVMHHLDKEEMQIIVIFRSALKKRIKSMYKKYLYTQSRARVDVSLHNAEGEVTDIADCTHGISTGLYSRPDHNVIYKDDIRNILRRLSVTEQTVFNILMEAYELNISKDIVNLVARGINVSPFVAKRRIKDVQLKVSEYFKFAQNV